MFIKKNLNLYSYIKIFKSQIKTKYMKNIYLTHNPNSLKFKAIYLLYKKILFLLTLLNSQNQLRVLNSFIVTLFPTFLIAVIMYISSISILHS